MKHKEKMKNREYRYGYIAGGIIGYLTILNSLIIFYIMAILSFSVYSMYVMILGVLINSLIDGKILRFYIRKALREGMKYKSDEESKSSKEGFQKKIDEIKRKANR